MITLQFKRTGDGVFVPHVDVLRSLNRTFRRADIEVEYSKGFNRHMALKLTQPIPFGVADEDCYAFAKVISQLSCEEIFYRFSESCPPFIVLTGVYETEIAPSLSGIINASLYRVYGEITDEQARKINGIRDYSVTNKKTGETKEVGGLIYSLKAEKERLDATLAFGNVNLRIDLLIEQLNADFGTQYSVTDAAREKQYIKDGEEFITAEEYLEKICREKFISKERTTV